MRDNLDYTTIEQQRMYKRLGVKKYERAERCKCGHRGYVRTKDGKNCLECVLKAVKK